MIDYEKLKKANELASKHAKDKGRACIIKTIHFINGEMGYHLDILIEDRVRGYMTLDGLISELEELTKPESRYKVGSTWWYVNGPPFESFPVPKSLLITEENQGWYRIDEEWLPSRESLIDDQIKYWVSLCKKPDEPDINHVVTHESDGLTYMTNPPQNKCTKCGEFYK